MSVLPVWSPVYLPGEHEGDEFRKLAVYFKAKEEKIKKFLPPPLELAGDILEVFVCKFRGKHSDYPPVLRFGEAGLLIPAKYKGITGSHNAVQYLTSVEIICFGREVLGQGNKYAENVDLFETDKDVEGYADRLGTRIISLRCRFTGKKFEIPKYFPRLQVKIIPSCSGVGLDVKKVLMYEVPGYSLKEAYTTKTGDGEVTFGQSEADPLYRLEPTEVVGGIFSTGRFERIVGKELASLL